MIADVWHTFSIHFLDIKLTKICSFAELVIKLVADWLGCVTIIYYLTNITVASHVHKITGNLTICSMVRSVKEKEKRRTTQYWSFLDKSTGCRRLPSLRDSIFFFNILTTLDYFLQSKSTWFKSRYAFVLLTFSLSHSVPEKTRIIIMELPNLLWNSVDISIMELQSRPMYIMELHHVDDGSPQIVWSSITANCRAPWIELWSS